MLSSFTWLAIIIILLLIKYMIILPREDKQLFELYEARDNVSIAAMRKEVDQDSEEYEFVIENINFWIYNTQNDYDFSNALYNMSRMASGKKKVFDRCIKNISSNLALSDGLKKINIHSKKIMRIKGWLFYKMVILILDGALAIVDFIVEVCNIGHRASKRLNEELQKSRKMKKNYETYANAVLRL